MACSSFHMYINSNNHKRGKTSNPHKSHLHVGNGSPYSRFHTLPTLELLLLARILKMVAEILAWFRKSPARAPPMHVHEENVRKSERKKNEGNGEEEGRMGARIMDGKWGKWVAAH